MSIKRFIVTAVDFDADGNCSGKATVCAVCKTLEEADEYVLNDMEAYVDARAGEDFIMDADRRRVADPACENGCDWNVEEVEIQM